MSLAMAAAEGGHVRPRLSRNNVLRIRGGALLPLLVFCSSGCPAKAASMTCCCKCIANMSRFQLSGARATKCHHSGTPNTQRHVKVHISGTGRHLLTEQVVDTFIPNDTNMSASADRVHVRISPTGNPALLHIGIHLVASHWAKNARVGICR